jgi:hypothetical protein
MPWVKLDDQFSDHPKLLKVGPLAGWLWVSGLAYSSRYLTDGFVPIEALPKLIHLEGLCLTSPFIENISDNVEEIHVDSLCKKLVDSGLWEGVDGGFRIHDFLEYNPSARQIKAERKAARERMALQRSQGVHKKFKRSYGEHKKKFSRSSPSPTPSRPLPLPLINTKEETKTPPADAGAVVDSSLNGWGTPEALVALYNTATPAEFPSVETLSDARRKKLKQYLSQFPAREFWVQVFEECHASPFLRGLRPSKGHETFCGSLDWLLSKGQQDQVENCVKVREGKYGDR